ncbi:hypothetical protein DFH07DRAFT_750075 [Mycena maculata]|uniref:GST N-terminal domain-containing protein n=1 Tax=Mycena maculata TaxID=230809 RepID=A0AAD7IHF9_9AGAR|nr:hypothetical protein DFH07DRAFT_750075 [Mycena maculata]
MAILKLVGMSKATCMRHVATVLHELKVPFKLVEVDLMNGQHKTPEFLMYQPFGVIPYIVRRISFEFLGYVHRP